MEQQMEDICFDKRVAIVTGAGMLFTVTKNDPDQKRENRCNEFEQNLKGNI